MRARRVVCVLAGHRWQTDAAADEPFPVLRCARCHDRRELTAETQSPEGWVERAARKDRVGLLFGEGGDIQRRPGR